jgi:uncharacterized protein YfiM (DUF2279 family)
MADNLGLILTLMGGTQQGRHRQLRSARNTSFRFICADLMAQRCRRVETDTHFHFVR